MKNILSSNLIHSRKTIRRQFLEEIRENETFALILETLIVNFPNFEFF